MPAVSRLEVEIGADTSEAEANLNRFSNGMGDRVGGFASKAGAALLGVGAAAATGAGAAAAFGLQAASSNEQAAVSFGVLLGSADKAKAFMGELSTFAAKTPFELPGLRDSASQMLGAGFAAKSIIPILTNVGNATSAMGTGADGVQRATVALNQMAQKGKVTGEELMQLQEAGVPALQVLAQTLGTDVAGAQDRVSKGLVDAKVLFGALESGASPALQKVSGLMDAQSNTLQGMVSTLKDTLSQGLGTALEPAMASIKGALPELTSTLGDALGSVAPQLGSLVGGAVDLLKDLLPQIAPLLGAVAETVGQTFRELGPAIAELGPPLLRLFQALLPSIPPLAAALADLVPAIVPVIDVFASLIEKIPADVLAGFLAAWLSLNAVKGQAGILGMLKPFVGLLPGLAAGLWSAVAPMLPFIAAAAAIAAAGYLIYRNWDTIAAFFTDLWGTVSGAASAAWDAVVGFATDLPGRIGSALAALPGIIGRAFTSAVRFALLAWYDLAIGMPLAIAEAIPRLLVKLVELQASMLQWLVGFALEAGTAALDLGASIAGGIWNGIAALPGFMADLPGLVWNALSPLPGVMWNVWKAVNDTAWGWVVQIGDNIWRGLKGLPDTLWNIGRSMVTTMAGVGVDVVTGLWNGLSSMGPWLYGKVWDWIKSVLPGPVKLALGIHSPSTVAAGLGSFFAQGLADGISGGQGIVSAASAGLARAASGALDGARPITMTLQRTVLTAAGAEPSIDLASPAMARGAVGAAASLGGSASANTPTQLVLPNGSVISLDELGRSMQILLLKDGRRFGGGALGGFA